MITQTPFFLSITNLDYKFSSKIKPFLPHSLILKMGEVGKGNYLFELSLNI